MKNYFLVLSIILFLFPFTTFALQTYNEMGIDTTLCNITYIDLEGNDTSCTLRSQDDLMYNASDGRLYVAFNNVSMVNIFGTLETDCSGSATNYNYKNPYVRLNVSGLPIYDGLYDRLLINGEADYPFGILRDNNTLISCIRTREGNYAMAKYHTLNSIYINITSQIANNWYFNNSNYQTKMKNLDDCTMPIFVHPYSFFINGLDYDNCLNYIYSYVPAPVIDEVYYNYISLSIIKKNVFQMNGGKTSEYEKTDCLNLKPNEYGTYSYADEVGAWFDTSYCYKTSDENLFLIEKTGKYTGNHSIRLQKIDYPPFFTQHLNLTDVDKVYLRTGIFDYDLTRGITRAFNYDLFDVTGNLSYDGYFDGTEGYLATGGSRLYNPQGTQTNKFNAYSYTPYNDLETFDCGFYEPYELFYFRNVRGLYSNEYPIICFNKTTNLKTAIKFINVTNIRGNSSSEFDVYFARYDNTNLIFSEFTYLPSAPKKNDNITLTWKSKIPLTTELKIQYRNPNNNQMSSWYLLANESETNTTMHNLVINAEKLPYETTYYIILKGTDENGTLYVDIKTYEIEVSQLPLIREVTGLAVCTFSEIGTPYPAYVSFNGNQMQRTQQYLTSDGITIHCIEYLGQFSLGDRFNVSAISFDGLRKANESFRVEQKPMFYKMFLSPKNSCIPYSYYTNEDDCLFGMNATKTMRENTGSTSSYCLYNPKECNQWNLSGFQQCIKKAGERTPPVSWILYSCYDGYHPKNIPVNQSGSKGLTPEGNIDISTSLCSGLGSIFNVECNSSLSFVALLISLILTAVVGIYSRNGLIAGLVLITSIMMFYFIGWLPVWIPLIMGVITALLIAKFIVSAISPQGSGD